jgi:hypothetical protein
MPFIIRRAFLCLFIKEKKIVYQFLDNTTKINKKTYQIYILGLKNIKIFAISPTKYTINR